MFWFMIYRMIRGFLFMILSVVMKFGWIWILSMIFILVCVIELWLCFFIMWVVLRILSFICLKC